MTANSRAARLAEEIEAAIRAAEIPDGGRLGTKDDLRLRYDVAHGTLNETLRILQMRGYVIPRSGPGGGLFASLPNSSERLRRLLRGFPEPASLKDCVEVRHALDEAVAVNAARSRSRRDIVELRAILKQMSALTDDPAAYLHQNWLLHRRIADCCRNRLLASLYITLLDSNEPARRIAKPNPRRTAEESIDIAAPRELVEAIASGSAEGARAAVAAHEKAVFAPVDDTPLRKSNDSDRRHHDGVR